MSLEAADEAWIKRHIAAGGTPDEARQIATKMASLRDASTGRALYGRRADDSISGLLATPTPQHPPLGSKPIPAVTGRLTRATDASRLQDAAPEAASQTADTANAAPTAASHNTHDLFGSAVDTRPVKQRTQPRAPMKTGPKPAAFNLAAPTDAQCRLFALSMDIEDRPAMDSGNQGYLATSMIYACMPHLECKGAVFERRNGNTYLSIVNSPRIGLPYGKIPRLITAYLCTEAKLKRTPEINLGHCQSDFMSRLGISRNGRDIARFRDQAKRLFTSSFSLQDDSPTGFQWENVNLTKGGRLLWNPHKPDEKVAWESKIKLTAEFFDECMHHSVPFDFRAFHQLKSSLAIDIYIWLTYRFNSVKQPTPISWRQLQWQFGSDYQDTPAGWAHFKEAFKKQLKNVLSFYREANLKVDGNVLVLLPSKPHVPASMLSTAA